MFRFLECCLLSLCLMISGQVSCWILSFWAFDSDEQENDSRPLVSDRQLRIKAGVKLKMFCTKADVPDDWQKHLFRDDANPTAGAILDIPLNTVTVEHQFVHIKGLGTFSVPDLRGNIGRVKQVLVHSSSFFQDDGDLTIEFVRKGDRGYPKSSQSA
jgi:hypothetical protein